MPRRLLAGGLLSLLAVTALVWAVVLTEIRRHHAETLRDAENEVELKAQMYAEATRPMLRRADDLLLDLREHWSGDWAAMDRVVRERRALASDLPFQLGVIGVDGRLAYSNLATSQNRTDLSDREHFRVHRDRGGDDLLFISRPLKGRVSGELSIQFTRPVRHQDRFAGVMVASLSPRMFTAVHDALDLGAGGASGILRDSGELMALQPGADALLGKRLALPMHRPDAPSRGHFSDDQSFDGVPRIMGYYRLPEYGWTFFAARSRTTVLIHHAAFRKTAVLAGAGLNVAALLLLALLFRALLGRARAQARLEAQDKLLAARERMLAATLDAMPIGITLSDPDGMIIYGNPRAADILGLSFEQQARRRTGGVEWTLVRPDGSALPPEELASARALRDRRPVEGAEMGIQTADGIRWLQVHAVPSPDPRYGVVVSYVDVTSARESEQAIADQRRLTKGVLDALGDLVWLKDPDGVYLACNRRFERFFGATEAEIVGKTDYDFVDRDLAESFRAHDRAAMEKRGPSVNYEWITFADDGHRELLETTKTAMADRRGRLVGIVGVGHDITERRRLEDELRGQQRRLSDIIEGTNVGTWEWNLVSGEVVFNERWAEMIGRTLAELEPLAGDAWLGQLHPDDRVATEAKLRDHLADTSERFEAEFRMRHKQGFWVWILALGRVSRRGPEGQALWMSGTQLDITERKATEEALSALATAMTPLAGDALYEAISRHLAESLTLDYVFVGRLHGAGTAIDVLSGWADGAPMTPFSYPLADTPCANVMERSTAIHARGVQLLFPKDDLLARMGIESYIGCALFDKSGHPMGTLVGLGRHPIHQPELANRLLGVFVDSVSAEMMRIHAEEAIVAARNRLDAILQTTQDAVWLIDRAGRIVDVNPAACRLLGYHRDEMLAHTLPEIDAVYDAPAIRDIRQRILREGGARFESRHRTKDGREVDVDIAVSDLPRERLEVAFIRDITERKQAERGLRQAASVFEFSHEGIMITDPDGMIIDINDAFCRITGYGRDEVIGRNPRILKSGRHDAAFYAAMWQGLKRQGFWTSEVWNRRKNGEIYAQMQTISAVKDRSGEVVRYVCLFSDITQQKEHQHQLERIAHYDDLTGLPNRVLLADRLRQAMAHAQRQGRLLAVVFLDLDGFKAINDRHGHEIGDKLLTLLSARLLETLRDVDTFSRLGGDEFVAVLVDLQSHEASAPIIDRLLSAAAEPIFVDGAELRVSASVGVSFFPQSSEVDGDQLLRQADQAMYQAKQAGKNRFHIFDVEHDRSVRGHHESLGRIAQALAQCEFVLLYQPKVNMRTGEVVGVEALIRWQHPERGLLPPAAFLPVIKGNPLINGIGDWVLDTALAQSAAWQRGGLSLPVSVNVDALQFDQPDFMDKLQAHLAHHPGFRPGDLVLEVLETSALEDVDQISEIIRACEHRGVHFALDDFGTGYSSLTYLKRLPAQHLKVDQSFVRGMLDSPEDLAILGGVLGLAEAFRRRAIAEGVETLEHGELLIQLGCDHGQGYAIARPMTADAVPEWVAHWKPDPRWTALRRIERNDLPVIYAMVEHRAWVRAFGRHLRDELPSPPPLDRHHCHFGQWLDEIGVERYGGDPVFQRVVDLHGSIHRQAGELLDLRRRGFDHVAQSQLAQLEALRDELLEELRGLVN